ncbi:MAG: DUF3253 domain-containing protein [Myxococcota bacterium]|nr:DUF3253 domain-containing protein [Myxococcota bacterium]
MTADVNETRICTVCGRRFGWQKRWARNWSEVRVCSERCRRSRPRRSDRALEGKILELLEARAATSSICPSEAARAVAGDEWRDWMERTRSAARRLAAAGRIQITQRGQPVDPATARGPIRLRLARS